MKIGDLVTVEYIGPGLVIQVDPRPDIHQRVRIRYVDGSRSWEDEHYVEVISEGR
jgi:hypothetical protein